MSMLNPSLIYMVNFNYHDYDSAIEKVQCFTTYLTLICQGTDDILIYILFELNSISLFYLDNTIP